MSKKPQVKGNPFKQGDRVTPVDPGCLWATSAVVLKVENCWKHPDPSTKDHVIQIRVRWQGTRGSFTTTQLASHYMLFNDEAASNVVKLGDYFPPRAVSCL